MLKYLKIRKEILNDVKSSISYLHDAGYVSNKTYVNIIHKKFIRKKDIFKVLKAFDEKYYGDSFDNSMIYKKMTNYGISQLGNSLRVVVLNDNENVDNTILITSAVHGFEGAYHSDGDILVNELVEVAEYYYCNEHNLKNTRLVIAPMCNPDGIFEGYSDESFGRCTYNGTDINRDFKDGGYKAIESVYLKQLIDKYKPNIHIDIHGWLNALYGDSDIIKHFYNNCLIERKYPNQWGVSKGYVIGYTHQNYDCKSALIEFSDPEVISARRIIATINEILEKEMDDAVYNARIVSQRYCDLINHDKDFVKKIIRKSN